ncbi:MAG: 3-deoxy-manno-octulosonate cytidylyltransferase [Nitrospiraceae bacterium]|nr:3-deoxy-manno-octulosonate cytidylyltransferase [Nitrospiraceae bacterium]
MSVLAVIPARFNSSRFPGKPLATLWGKPLIQTVYEAASQCSSVDHVIVATDNVDIEQCVQGFHGDVVLTESSARTGTDRVAEVTSRIPAEAIVNIQGDEVLLDLRLLEDLIDPFLESSAQMGTLCRPMTKLDNFHNPNVVKVVIDSAGKALYFSRSAIPFHREHENHVSISCNHSIYEHVGVYIYRRQMLRKFAAMPTGILEAAENLEQLRAMEAGIAIQTWKTTYPSIRIDTHDDLMEAEKMAPHLISMDREIQMPPTNTRNIQ